MKLEFDGNNTRLAIPTPVVIVGTYDAHEKVNMMNVAWAGVAGSEPPCIAISLRPTRYTYENIVRSRIFSVGIPSEDRIAESDYFGLVSGRNEDKLEKSGLTVKDGSYLKVPIVNEFPVSFECKLKKTLELDSHVLMIGEIMKVHAEEEYVDESGKIDLLGMKPLIYDPVAVTYHSMGDVIGKAFGDGLKIKNK